ncbi:MAG TPA: RNA 2',3'-cyclic phosphodiesterase, partial [Nitrospirota bacterium]|nr:RNA 2',3'-cyclic phosphodiesterase [Nitrospirota bacterium]
MPEKELVRTFIAIELPADVKTALVGLQATLRKHGGDVGWVRPEGVHLTLKFLGPVEAEKIAPLSDALADALKDTGKVRLEPMGVGVFPTPRSPRVIWVGLTGGLDALAAIAERVESVCEGF